MKRTMKVNSIVVFFRIAACVAVGVVGLWFGRTYLRSILVRKSVADRTEAIGRTRPWIVDAARRTGGRLSILVFKKEQVVEVHAPRWTKPRRYEMTGFSGSLGPKLHEGDGQIPEGIYGVEYLNPNSMFHLSLKVSYPNEFDKARAAEDGRCDLGGDIMIHGGNATVGCIPIGDDAIEELFFLVAAVGKENSSIVISPYDMRKGRVNDLEKSTLRWYPALCDTIYKSLLSLTAADGLPYGQERLERWLYSIEPDDDPGDDEPPYVPHRSRDALTEFRAFLREVAGQPTSSLMA